MNTTKNISRNFDAIGWGTLFVWWCISLMLPSMLNGVAPLGTGLILIGVNIARKLAGLPMSGLSTTIGNLAIVWGMLELAGVLVNLPFETTIFSLLLIVLGLIVLAPELKRNQAQ
jgi:hypothetical protein